MCEFNVEIDTYGKINLEDDWNLNNIYINNNICNYFKIRGKITSDTNISNNYIMKIYISCITSEQQEAAQITSANIDQFRRSSDGKINDFFMVDIQEVYFLNQGEYAVWVYIEPNDFWKLNNDGENWYDIKDKITQRTFKRFRVTQISHEESTDKPQASEDNGSEISKEVTTVS